MSRVVANFLYRYQKLPYNCEAGSADKKADLQIYPRHSGMPALPAESNSAKLDDYADTSLTVSSFYVTWMDAGSCFAAILFAGVDTLFIYGIYKLQITGVKNEPAERQKSHDNKRHLLN